MKSREERVIGSELQPAVVTSSSGERNGTSIFEEEEEVEVLLDKG